MFDLEQSRTSAAHAPDGFQVEQAQLQVVGVCADCQRA
jgi:Fe2+ or Zn2+ uptake regulation protein